MSHLKWNHSRTNAYLFFYEMEYLEQLNFLEFTLVCDCKFAFQMDTHFLSLALTHSVRFRLLYRQLKNMSSPGPSNKRKRNVVSIETKLEIIKELKKGATTVSLSTKYGMPRQTISDLKKKQMKLKNLLAKWNH